MNTAQIEMALAKKYPEPEFAFLLQVRNQTGFSRTTRTADALAMSLYPSRGIELHGFEIKASRSDWVKELENPDKAEEICRFCDRWWIAVGDESIVRAGELPPNWGLLVPNGDRMVARVQAPKLPAIPLTTQMIAGIMRNVAQANSGRLDRSEVNAMKAQVRKEEADTFAEQVKRINERCEDRVKKLAGTIADFEKASGIRIHEYNAGKIGSTVAMLSNWNGQEDHANAMLSYARSLQNLADQAKASAEEIKNLKTKINNQ